MVNTIAKTERRPLPWAASKIERQYYRNQTIPHGAPKLNTQTYWRTYSSSRT